MLSREPDERALGAGGLTLVHSTRASAYRAWGKRTLEVAIIVVLSPAWATLYGAITLALLVTQGRPIHHRSERIGMGGRPFTLIKFRTMTTEADGELATLRATDLALDLEFRSSYKLRNDPRVTRVGRALRRLSLDELPQLLNVLVGHMSLIGPRPVLRAELDEFYGEAAPLVLQVRPGMTGLWQVSGRSLLSYTRRVHLDVKYVNELRPALDLAILARTLPSVVKGHGAF